MFDHQLIGDLLESQIGRTFRSWPEAERVSGMSRSTLYRIKDGDTSVKPATYRRLERAFGYQLGAINSLAGHDFDTAHQLGVPPDIIEWARQRTA